jgi:predicted extracellular nuclease
VRAAADALLEGQGQDRSVVVAGDLNDEPQAATTQILLGPGGSEIGTAGVERPDKGDAHRLWNLAPLISKDERFSRVYRGRGELIDHVLVSHALVGTASTVTTGGVDISSIGDDWQIGLVGTAGPASWCVISQHRGHRISTLR